MKSAGGGAVTITMVAGASSCLFQGAFHNVVLHCVDTEAKHGGFAHPTQWASTVPAHPAGAVGTVWVRLASPYSNLAPFLVCLCVCERREVG